MLRTPIQVLYEDCFSLQEGLTALIIVTRQENVEMVQLLVDGKADVNTFENVSFTTTYVLKLDMMSTV